MAFSMVFSGDKYVDTEVGEILADLGDASGSTLTSLYAILGNPTSPISTVLGTNVTMGVGGGSAAANSSVQSMVRYITDNGAKEATLGAPLLNTAASTLSLVIGDPGASDLSTRVKAVQDYIGVISNTTLADTLAATLGDFGAQSLVDRLDLIYSPHTWVGSISTTNYVDAGAEQTIVELSPGANIFEVAGIFLDLSSMTQNGTVKVYLKIDGTNYRELSSDDYLVGVDSVGVWVDFKGLIMDDLKVTYTEAADEGADRTVPYQVVRRSI